MVNWIQLIKRHWRRPNPAIPSQDLRQGLNTPAQIDPNNRPAIPSRDDRVAALRTVYDPEIPVNLYDLGLIYDLDIAPDGAVHIRMTLTTPACPVAQQMPGRVAQAVEQAPGVTRAHVDLIWEPPWNQDKISDEAKLQLGLL